MDRDDRFRNASDWSLNYAFESRSFRVIMPFTNHHYCNNFVIVVTCNISLNVRKKLIQHNTRQMLRQHVMTILS